MGTLYTCCRSLKTDSFCSLPVTKNPPVFLTMAAGCISHRPPLPPPAAPAGITHYTLQARSCAKGEEDSPLETPGFVGVWPKTAFLRPRPHPSETQRSGADQPTPRADLRRFFTRPAGRDGRKRIGKNRVFGLQFSANWVIIKSTRVPSRIMRKFVYKSGRIKSA